MEDNGTAGRRDVLRRDVLRLGGLMGAGGLGLLAGLRLLPGFAADTPALKPVNIVNAAGSATSAMQALLDKFGFLRQMGLDATTVNVSDGSKLMGSLLNGGEDICLLSGFSQVLPAIEKGAKVKIIAGTNLLSLAPVFAKKPEIKRLRDLVGRTVGTGSPGALLHQLMVAMFVKQGIDYSKVTFVNIGSSTDVFRAVVAGTVDAGPGQLDTYPEQAKYGVHALDDGNSWTEIPQYTAQAAFASEETIAKKRDVLVRTLAAYSKLYRFIQGPGSQDAFVDAYVASAGGSDPESARRAGAYEWAFFQKYKPYDSGLGLSQGRIDYMQNLNIRLGIQKRKLSYDQIADLSLARDAVKLLG